MDVETDGRFIGESASAGIGSDGATASGVGSGESLVNESK